MWLYIVLWYERTSPAVQIRIIQPTHVLSSAGGIDMWLPDKLYEFLPILHGIAGLFTVYKFDTTIGY